MGVVVLCLYPFDAMKCCCPTNAVHHSLTDVAARLDVNLQWPELGLETPLVSLRRLV